MTDKTSWDWQTEEKQIPFKEWQDRYNWVEEPVVSPDGEKIAAIVNQDEMEFSVCENGTPWEETFEKAWSLKFAPNGDLSVLAANDEEWTVCTNQKFWEATFDFAWDLNFSPDGRFTGIAFQKDSQYGMAVNGREWETLYENINGMVLSSGGSSAAIVQTDPLGQADTKGFSKGIFSAAVNGAVQSEKFMNIWNICFDSQDRQIAYAVRKNRFDYTIVKGRTSWDSSFQSVWSPVFFNRDQSVVAPVRLNGKWTLFKDDSPFWNKQFEQLWNPAVHEGTQKIAAIVSDTYGKWSICENNDTWSLACNGMICDLSYSDDGSLLTAVYKNDRVWDLVVNRRPWHLKADKLWAPQISTGSSPDDTVIATRMEKDNQYYLVVNGQVYPQAFDMVFDPRISPDNRHILLKSIRNGIYSRQVLPLDKIL